MEAKRISIRDIAMCAVFTALIAAGAFIKIPIPVVPFTLQILFTTMAGILLGGRLGMLSVCVYVALGLVGFPIFASGGGLTYIFQPTFGYLIGFIIGTWLTGTIAHQKSHPSTARLLCACYAGMFVVYAIGLVYCWMINHLYLQNDMSVKSILFYGFLLYAPGDILMCGSSALLAKRILPIWNK